MRVSSALRVAWLGVFATVAPACWAGATPAWHRTAQGLAERRDQEMKNLADGIQQSQQRAVTELARATDEGMQTLRRSHEDQSNRLQRVVQEHAGWNKAVLFGIGVVALGIGALIVLQLVK